MNTPVDPDKLRARLTQAVEPVKPSPDALVQIRAGVRRRRRLQWTFGSGAGVLAIAGATAAVIGIGSLADPSAAPRTVQPGYSPTAGTAPTTTSAPTPASSPSAATSPSGTASAGPVNPVVLGSSPASAVATPASVVRTTTTPAGSTPTTTTGSVPPPVADDLDRDGKADTAVVERTGSQARVVVHLNGRTVTSAPFDLGLGSTAGRVTFISVNRDGRSEILVSGLGASAQPYYLFQYARGEVTQVGPPAGKTSPWVVSGGGYNAELDFGCTAAGLVVSNAGPQSLANYNPNTASYAYSTATYRFQDDALVKVAGSSRTGLMRTAALALAAAQPHDRCGAS